MESGAWWQAPVAIHLGGSPAPQDQSLTTRTGSRTSRFTQGAAPSGTSYAIHSTRSRHASFTSPEGLKQHVSGTLSRPGSSCSLATDGASLRTRPRRSSAVSRVGPRRCLP
ncbi:Hypothetical protein DHA2_153858 [Giardia duodenalis]|uniref:Uncharacterized protein n=1 Tax=Giardia intestinalis TaxID=5741 RepID=V6T9H3_GIAIN|nr:Hypothetical protein DHA2_153858 [Giardia intestinalis]